jgi:biotin carboxyl carrier protein
MATTERGWLPAAMGIVTMALALWVAWSLASPAADESAAAGEATTTVTVTTVATSVAPVVITTPPPEMEGLSESVARVLSASGFASELTADDIAAELPGSVYRTLVDQGVVLSIATEGP